MNLEIELMRQRRLLQSVIDGLSVMADLYPDYYEANDCEARAVVLKGELNKVLQAMETYNE